MRKKGTLLLYIIVFIILAGYVVYEVIFAVDKDYYQMIKTGSSAITCLIVIGAVIKRSQRLDRTSLEIVQHAFSQDKRSHKKLMKAIDAFFSGEYTRALLMLKDLRTKCASHKDAVVVEMFIGMCYHGKKKYEDAIKVYEGMVYTDAQNAYAWTLLGCVYDACNRRKEAFEVYKTALNAQPNNAYVVSCLAYHCMELKKIQVAMKFAHEAYRLDSKRNDILPLLAVIYALSGNGESAKKIARCYIGRKKEMYKLHTWIRNICNNQEQNIDYYCSNIRQFQRLFWL